MTCPLCAERGKKSSVHPDGFGTVTAMMSYPYYDENGVYHMHDLNTRTSEGRCSNGHTYVRVSGGSCPAGDYGGEDSITWK